MGGARCPGVVLLHGIARTSASLKRLERALQATGFASLNIDYASRSKPIAALADDIHPEVARFAKREAPLYFVAHSMGGLVTRAYIAKYRPARLAGVVMMGTPNSGSEVADLSADIASTAHSTDRPGSSSRLRPGPMPCPPSTIPSA